jgi:hypothetical protein
MLNHTLDKVLDAVDIETFFVCGTELEARNLMLNLLKEMGFSDVDVVFVQQLGPGARIRGRAYVHRPSDRYRWLAATAGQGSEKL